MKNLNELKEFKGRLIEYISVLEAESDMREAKVLDDDEIVQVIVQEHEELNHVLEVTDHQG